jgi:hypothetical protein
VYARLLYPSLARQLGWPPLEEHPELRATRHPGGPVTGHHWRRAYFDLLHRATSEAVAAEFRPGTQARRVCMGSIDPGTGVMGQAATILVRRARRSRALSICARSLPAHPSLYPMRLWATVPSASSSSRAETTVPGPGGDEHCFELTLPDDISAGSAVDVVLEAERTAVGSDRLRAESVAITSIEQL